MKNLAALDVVLAGVRVGESRDPRPCVVVEVLPGQGVVLMPCSSQFDLYREGVDFPIRDHEPGFAATKLKASSYVIDRSPALLEESAIKVRLGRLTGVLAERFWEWFVVD